jgi:hypothetical protein
VNFDQVLQICPPIAEAVKDMVKRREEFLAPAALRAAWPLSTISDASAAALVEQGFRLDVVPTRTQLFCAPGSACAALTVVLHGTVAVTQSGADDRLRISAGGFLGEATLLADADAEAQPRLLTATAVDDCVLAVLPRESLAALMGRDEGVKASVRGVADAWVAGRSPQALARHWLLAPLAAWRCSGDTRRESLDCTCPVHQRLVVAIPALTRPRGAGYARQALEPALRHR